MATESPVPNGRLSDFWQPLVGAVDRGLAAVCSCTCVRDMQYSSGKLCTKAVLGHPHDTNGALLVVAITHSCLSQRISASNRTSSIKTM